MTFVPSVRGYPREIKVLPGAGKVSRATVHVVWGDVIGLFVVSALRSKPTRISQLNSWHAENDVQLRALLARERRHRAVVAVVTSPTALALGRLTALVDRQREARVGASDRLHAKPYVSPEGNRREVVTVGSADLIAACGQAVEVGPLVRPSSGSHIIDDLATVLTAQFGARGTAVQGKARRSA